MKITLFLATYNIPDRAAIGRMALRATEANISMIQSSRKMIDKSEMQHTEESAWPTLTAKIGGEQPEFNARIRTVATTRDSSIQDSNGK